MLSGEHCTELNHAVHAHVTPRHLRLSKGVRSWADSPRNRSALNYREAFVCLATSGSAGARPPESARWPRGRLRSPPRPGAPRSGQAACASPAAPSPSWGGPQTVLEVSSPRGWEGAPRSLHGQPPVPGRVPRRAKPLPLRARLRLESTARPRGVPGPAGASGLCPSAEGPWLHPGARGTRAVAEPRGTALSAPGRRPRSRRSGHGPGRWRSPSGKRSRVGGHSP